MSEITRFAPLGVSENLKDVSKINENVRKRSGRGGRYYSKKNGIKRASNVHMRLCLSCAFQGVENCPRSGESKHCVDSSLKCLPALSVWLRIAHKEKRARLVGALRF